MSRILDTDVRDLTLQQLWVYHNHLSILCQTAPNWRKRWQLRRRRNELAREIQTRPLPTKD